MSGCGPPQTQAVDRGPSIHPCKATRGRICARYRGPFVIISTMSSQCCTAAPRLMTGEVMTMTCEVMTCPCIPVYHDFNCSFVMGTLIGTLGILSFRGVKHEGQTLQGPKMLDPHCPSWAASVYRTCPWLRLARAG